MESSPKSSSTASNPPWTELPQEITAKILHKLGSFEILMSAHNVCTTWRRVCRDVSMWRVIDLPIRGDIESLYDPERARMCREAVDRSQGQLVDINIEYFGTDDLLLYIAERASGLRRLRLVWCYHIRTKCLIEAVQKFPLLEEMHMYYTLNGEEIIEAVGRSCPVLKSFTLNSHGYRRPHLECDREALAIAGNMPKLRHLQLFGNKMTNEGLQAILDGCPLLESLDIRQCFNVNLGGDLGKLCSQRIKGLRHPYDSPDDFEFDTTIIDYESLGEDWPSGFSDSDMSDYDDHLEFSNGSESSYDFEEENY